MDREDAVETGDLEDLGDVAVAAHERQLALIRAQALDAADEHAERGRVDERRVAEVDDDVATALIDHVEQLLLELRGGVEVDLAREGDHVLVVAQLLGLDVEIHVFGAPGVADRNVCVVPRSRVSLTGRGRLLRRLQLCDLLLHDLRARVVGREREEALVRLDRPVDVPALLRCLRQLELDVRIPRSQGGQLVISLLRLLVGGLRLRVRLVHLLRGLSRDRLVDRIGAERRAVAEVERNGERRAEREVAGAELRDLCVLPPRVREPEMEAGELAERVLVLRALLDVLGQDGDRLRGLPVLLERRSQIALRRGAARIVLQLLPGVADREVAARRAAAVAKDVADPGSLVGPDSEGDEADREHEREEDEHPLRVPAQPREEHRVFDRYEIAVALAGRSMRPRAADAAAISSCHSVPPLSYLVWPSTRVAVMRSGEPTSASRPSARAPPSVASSRASVAESASARSLRARAIAISVRSSSKKSCEGTEETPSVPTPIRSPAARSSSSGAIPQPRNAFERGQCVTPTPCRDSSPISSASTLTQCAAATRSSSSPAAARLRMPLMPGGSTSISANGCHGPRPCRSQSSSSWLSFRCVATGRSSATAAA